MNFHDDDQPDFDSPTACAGWLGGAVLCSVVARCGLRTGVWIETLSVTPIIDAVDENDYEAFLDLTQQQIEKLTVAVMLDQEKEVRRLAVGAVDPAATARITKLVRNVPGTISIGVARFDAFGRLGFVSCVGPESTVEIDTALARKYQAIEPMIANTVRRTLPRLLSRESTPVELPL